MIIEAVVSNSDCLSLMLGDQMIGMNIMILLSSYVAFSYTSVPPFSFWPSPSHFTDLCYRFLAFPTDASEMNVLFLSSTGAP